jgi:hypothetical protein
VIDIWIEIVWRQDALRIAGVDAGFLDVLHHAADHHAVAIRDRVDIELGGGFEKLVDQERTVVSDQRAR